MSSSPDAVDVGKIATQGAHSDGHAAAGERTLGAIPALQRYAFWIRAHHERLDGSGDPDRLRAADIRSKREFSPSRTFSIRWLARTARRPFTKHSPISTTMPERFTTRPSSVLSTT